MLGLGYFEPNIYLQLDKIVLGSAGDSECCTKLTMPMSLMMEREHLFAHPWSTGPARSRSRRTAASAAPRPRPLTPRGGAGVSAGKRAGEFRIVGMLAGEKDGRGSGLFWNLG